jgi:hypothetical protein
MLEKTEAHSSSDRAFTTFSLTKEQVHANLTIVVFDNGQWDILDVTYKNCTFQDESRDKMLDLLFNLMDGHLVQKKTLIRKKVKWIVTNQEGKELYFPYEVQ